MGGDDRLGMGGGGPDSNKTRMNIYLSLEDKK